MFGDKYDVVLMMILMIMN